MRSEAIRRLRGRNGGAVELLEQCARRAGHAGYNRVLAAKSASIR
jgi:hypothetical protein